MQQVMYNDIPKRTRTAIKARIHSTIDKYGFLYTRAVVNRVFNDIRDREKLEQTIDEKSDELSRLKKRLKR